MRRALFVLVLLASVAALADVTVNFLSANATVDTVTLAIEPDGGLSYAVCGHVSPQGTSPITPCTPAADVPAGAARTNLLNFFSGGALTQYKTANGL